MLSQTTLRQTGSDHWPKHNIISPQLVTETCIFIYFLLLSTLLPKTNSIIFYWPHLCMPGIADYVSTNLQYPRHTPLQNSAMKSFTRSVVDLQSCDIQFWVIPAIGCSCNNAMFRMDHYIWIPTPIVYVFELGWTFSLVPRLKWLAKSITIIL